MSQLKALAKVVAHRLSELDSEILASRDPREVRRLWRTRRKLLKIGRVLIGIVK